MTVDPVREFVRKLVYIYDTTTMAFQAGEFKAESEGYRLVDGGQEFDDMVRFYDYRTGNTLVTMTQGQGEVFVWPIDWWHIDSVHDDSEKVGDVVWEANNVGKSSLPRGLMDALREWVDSKPEEARHWSDHT